MVSPMVIIFLMINLQQSQTNLKKVLALTNLILFSPIEIYSAYGTNLRKFNWSVRVSPKIKSRIQKSQFAQK